MRSPRAKTPICLFSRTSRIHDYTLLGDRIAQCDFIILILLACFFVVSFVWGSNKASAVAAEESEPLIAAENKEEEEEAVDAGKASRGKQAARWCGSLQDCFKVMN